ncbi:hypothetical protein FRB93_003251 [Tulasnella sp. JGI-2019a]|nr:hypothetical protein FRB93_003251 [Tulasnella sp. JGI-2019a]
MSFGLFRGPLPKGRYAIRNDAYAVTLYSIVNHGTVYMTTADEISELQMWDFEYGLLGYRIKCVANGAYLSYSQWAVPTRILNANGNIVASSNSPVEWRLVQTSAGFQPRTFQLRLVAGNNLQPIDDLSLINNGNSWLGIIGSASASSFTIRALSKPDDSGDSSLGPKQGAKVVIRSAMFPRIALDTFKSGIPPGFLVLGNPVNGEDSQTWTCLKGGRGFRFRNLMSENALGFATVSGTPANLNSAVCQDDKSVEWVANRSTNGYEIRLASDLKMLLTIWNADAAANSWIYLASGTGANGTANSNQQWFFFTPETQPNSETVTVSRSMAMPLPAGEVDTQKPQILRAPYL